jgi:hypothetical protein
LPFGLTQTLAQPISVANELIDKLEDLTDLTLPKFEEQKAPNPRENLETVRVPEFQPPVRVSDYIRQFETPETNTAIVTRPVYLAGRFKGYISYTILV